MSPFGHHTFSFLTFLAWHSTSWTGVIRLTFLKWQCWKLGGPTDMTSFTPPGLTQRPRMRSILVTAFHPENNNLKQIVNCNWGLLEKRHSTLPVSNCQPLVAYRRHPNLKNLLVRANSNSELARALIHFLWLTGTCNAESAPKHNMQTLITKCLAQANASCSITASSSLNTVTRAGPKPPTKQLHSNTFWEPTYRKDSVTMQNANFYHFWEVRANSNAS